MNDPKGPRSASELFSTALGQFSHLVRTEFQLARSEIAAKVAETGVRDRIFGRSSAFNNSCRGSAVNGACSVFS